MTRREYRGKWLFLILTAVIMIGPLIEIALTARVEIAEKWNTLQWWLGAGLGFLFPMMFANLKLNFFSSRSWLHFLAIVGVCVVVTELLPAGSVWFGFTAALPVLLLYLWKRQKEALRTWVVLIGLAYGSNLLVASGPMAIYFLVAEPFILATYIPVSVAAVGLLGIGAAVAISRSSAVRAFHRFHHTGMPEGPDYRGLLAGGCIFISYRRAEGEHLVGRMYDRLVQAVGEDRVFLDTQSIPIATLFQDELERRLEQASVELVIIGPTWVGATDDAGRRRLDNPKDFVRLEIRKAIEREVPLVPVLIDGARMPRIEELPEDIVDLVAYEAFVMGSGSDFQPSMEKLINEMRRPDRARAASHRAAPTVLFELRSDLKEPDPVDPYRLADVSWAEYVNNGLMAAVGARPLRIVGWSARPYRVQCEADLKTFELLRTQLILHTLDRVTGVRWESVTRLDQGGSVGCLPSQYPLKEDAEVDGLVCHLGWILGFLREEDDAKQYVGKPTHDLENVRVYVTRKWLFFFTFTYVHSNYIKPGRDYPTKVCTTSQVSLFTILTNLLFDHRLDPDLTAFAMALHKDRVQYFVNERKFPKGDVAFFGQAEHIHWVWVRSRLWWWPF